MCAMVLPNITRDLFHSLGLFCLSSFFLNFLALSQEGQARAVSSFSPHLRYHTFEEMDVQVHFSSRLTSIWIYWWETLFLLLLEEICWKLPYYLVFIEFYWDLWSSQELLVAWIFDAIWYWEWGDCQNLSWLLSFQDQRLWLSRVREYFSFGTEHWSRYTPWVSTNRFYVPRCQCIVWFWMIVF